LISPWNGGFEDADGLKERISALALNYGILLSTPLKNCKKVKAEDGRSDQVSSFLDP
jgi:hypothetical protein